MKKNHLSASVPRSLHMLYCYSKRALEEGRYISMILDRDVFGNDYKLILHIDDIIPLYHLDPISANCVVGYIWHLYKNILKDKKMEKFRFVNPHSIPYVSKNTQDKTGKLERLNHNASVLADRLSGASVDQLVLCRIMSVFIGSSLSLNLTRRLFICWIPRIIAFAMRT
ncbi:uncharacterized protein LOC142537638 [Primulina tabacum]|uniref:uncharacterized protein LOC142537638 n=1 Tax=Primulina tabacum TaxID=48773 RepID=UPI003F59AC99